MPRPANSIKTVPVIVYLQEHIRDDLRQRFRDPTNRHGVKHGAISQLINALLTKHINDNPVFSQSEMEKL